MHVPPKILDRMAPGLERRRSAAPSPLDEQTIGWSELTLLAVAALAGFGWCLLPWVCIYKLLF